MAMIVKTGEEIEFDPSDMVGKLAVDSLQIT